MIALRILCFAQAREKLGFAERTVSCKPTATPREIVGSLVSEPVCEAISCWRVALDQEYADWDVPIGDATEMALLPPVSGG